MAPTFNQDDFMRNLSMSPKQEYTLSEALEIEKILNNLPSTGKRINWVNKTTGSPVSIGTNK